MERDILILTKSWKNRKWCVVGVDINTKEIIRLVSSDDEDLNGLSEADMEYGTNNSAVPLDIARVSFIKPLPLRHQPENWLVDTDKYWLKVRSITENELLSYVTLTNASYLYYNTWKALDESFLLSRHPSVLIAKIENIQAFKDSYRDTSGNTGQQKNKLNFIYQGNSYKNISLTDPDIQLSANNTEDAPLSFNSAIAVVTLPPKPWAKTVSDTPLYYKFVAKLFIPKITSSQLSIDSTANTKTYSHYSFRNHIRLTQEGYDRLKAELILLRTEVRTEVVARLEEARGFGNLSENIEYHIAKQEQEKLEARIIQLENQLSKALVIDSNYIDTSIVSLGTRVTLEENGRDPVVYQIVSTEEADIKANPPKISIDSPIGCAILNAEVHQTVIVRTPRGIRKLKIAKIEK